MTIGGINLAKFAKKGFEIKYHDIDRRVTQWWTLELEKFKFGDASYAMTGD